MNLTKNSLVFDHFRLPAISLGCSGIDFDNFLFGYNLGILSILSALAMPLIPDYELFSERVNTFKPEKQILG